MFPEESSQCFEEKRDIQSTRLFFRGPPLQKKETERERGFPFGVS